MKKDEKVVTTENIFENLSLKTEPDFTNFAKLISKNINEGDRPKKFTYSYVKNIVELLSPSLDSIKTNDLIKYLTVVITDKKKEEADKKAKGIIENNDQPMQKTTSSKRNMDDDFF